LNKRIASDFLYSDTGYLNFLASAEDGDSNEYKMRILKHALKKVIEEDLTSRQREFLVLYYYQDLTMEQIGQMRGVHKSTVSRLIKVAKLKIEKQLKYIMEG